MTTIAGIVAAWLSTACSGTTTPGTAPQACSPGKQIACACPDTSQTGVQTCTRNGAGYTACTGCPGTGGSGAGGGPQILSPECDVLAQTGCSDGEACVDKYDGTNYHLQCVPNGFVAPGGDCSFDVFGNSDCERGSRCATTALGDSDPGAPIRHAECRAYCASDGDCAAKDPVNPLCQRVAPGVPWGLCLPSCMPFSSDCGPTGTCAGRRVDMDGVTDFLVCHFAGPSTTGTTCKSEVDCGPDQLCESVHADPPAAVCRELCDVGHPCPAGTICTTMGSQVGECK